jgi:O-antigen ligase
MQFRVKKFLSVYHPKKSMPLFVLLFLISGCNRWGIDPQVQFGLIMIVAMVSFIMIFSKPILGVYAVSIISIAFSPPIRIGFANLYFHQWVILIALLAAVSSGLILGNFHMRIKSEINIPMMVFIGSLLLSLSHAPNIIVGIKSFLYIGVLIASYYLVLLCINTESHIKIFAGILIVIIFVICLISLGSRESGRLGSLVLRNPNTFGNFLALVIPFCISLLMYGEVPGGKKVFLAGCSMVMFINLALTFSRSAWVGVFTSILCLSFLRPKKTLFFLLCCIIGTVFFISPIQKRMIKDIYDPGAQYRIIKAKIAYKTFKEHPILGNGLGSFHYEAQFSDVWAYRAHSTLENNYLLMLAEGGIIEFLAFLYLMVVFMKKALVLIKRIQPSFLHAASLGSVMSITSTLVAGMFEDTLFFPRNNWLIGIFMGMVIAIERIHREQLSGGEGSSIPEGAEESIG